MTPTTPPAGLDFASIRQQYPAAHMQFMDWLNVGNGSQGLVWRCDEQQKLTLWHPRDLFDFFDQQGVWVTLENSGGRAERIFFGRIEANGRYYSAGGKVYPTRAGAETAAFMAAFERLEKMLKQEMG